jgi:hypothetical protein
MSLFPNKYNGNIGSVAQCFSTKAKRIPVPIEEAIKPSISGWVQAYLLPINSMANIKPVMDMASNVAPAKSILANLLDGDSSFSWFVFGTKNHARRAAKRSRGNCNVNDLGDTDCD